jgi:2-amino-4-hydroxy-6-hydroxymethyldihydropteridine diphosphokinase
MNNVYLLIGGNMGDRLENLKTCTTHIQQEVGLITKTSSIYETAAWGVTDQPSFLNQVLVVSTHLRAEEVLKTVLAIEENMGRKRLQKMGPRTIDIDILFYNNDIISLPNLIIPHPHIDSRRFVLEPLAEIAASFVHPVLHKSIAELLKACPDTLEVKIFSRRMGNT